MFLVHHYLLKGRFFASLLRNCVLSVIARERRDRSNLIGELKMRKEIVSLGAAPLARNDGPDVSFGHNPATGGSNA
ncbi:MAG: hypothetical protein C4532_20160 [Candidatus Abyssobacteria bacterium SURF_17]|uniref:Uncharacterized protein n=1 Tax=Candidatus Abyssobacteria bacterium SURF_17 TaxID=2093361 RepID=A0A419EMU6_9BACT|nr:MAG: hypothetical protein C4532_20160 [Candidatus Abyssubacteria bacterium SURF_17]